MSAIFLYSSLIEKTRFPLTDSGARYDAQTGEYTSIQLRSFTALQDAASVASVLITTEAMVAETPKKETPAPAMPGGGVDY